MVVAMIVAMIVMVVATVVVTTSVVVAVVRHRGFAVVRGVAAVRVNWFALHFARSFLKSVRFCPIII